MEKVKPETLGSSTSAFHCGHKSPLLEQKVINIIYNPESTALFIEITCMSQQEATIVSFNET
jgi:hypothetical protein